MDGRHDDAIKSIQNDNVNVNVKDIYRRGAACQEFESEAPATEENVACSREQFSIQLCLECGHGSGTFRNWRQRVPDSWCRDAECFGL